MPTQHWIPEGRPADKNRIPAHIFETAFDTAFPGLPSDIPLDQAERRIAAALNAAWPLIEQQIRDDIAEQVVGRKIDRMRTRAQEAQDAAARRETAERHESFRQTPLGQALEQWSQGMTAAGNVLAAVFTPRPTDG